MEKRQSSAKLIFSITSQEITLRKMNVQEISIIDMLIAITQTSFNLEQAKNF